jgi:hypothetical protein
MYCERLLKAIVFPCLLLFSLTAFSQEKTITGKVTDHKDGSPMAGVSVTAKGSSAGTQTKEFLIPDTECSGNNLELDDMIPG